MLGLGLGFSFSLKFNPLSFERKVKGFKGKEKFHQGLLIKKSSLSKCRFNCFFKTKKTVKALLLLHSNCKFDTLAAASLLPNEHGAAPSRSMTKAIFR